MIWNFLVKQGRNVSTTPLRQWGFRQCLPFSWTTLRGKHCQHPIAVTGVVDTFGLGPQTGPSQLGFPYVDWRKRQPLSAINFLVKYQNFLLKEFIMKWDRSSKKLIFGTVDYSWLKFFVAKRKGPL